MSKQHKTNTFDSDFKQYTEAYNLIVDNPELHDIANPDDLQNKLDNALVTYEQACQANIDKARSWYQELYRLEAKVVALEPQTTKQDLQKDKLHVKILERLNRLLETISWLFVANIAYSQGRLDGSHKAEEKPMD